MTTNTKKAIGAAVAALLLYYVVASPETAAGGAYELVKWAGTSLQSLADSIRQLLDNLMK